MEIWLKVTESLFKTNDIWLKIANIWLKIKIFLEEMGADFSFILAGMLGAIVRLNRQKKLTKFEKFISILVGGVLANYITPLVLYWFNIKYNAGYVVKPNDAESLSEAMRTVEDTVKTQELLIPRLQELYQTKNLQNVVK